MEDEEDEDEEEEGEEEDVSGEEEVRRQLAVRPRGLPKFPRGPYMGSPGSLGSFCGTGLQSPWRCWLRSGEADSQGFCGKTCSFRCTKSQPCSLLTCIYME